MARTIVTSQTLFFVLILFVLAIFFYNVLHFSTSNRLRDHQCDEIVVAKNVEISRLNAQLVDAGSCPPPDDSSDDVDDVDGGGDENGNGDGNGLAAGGDGVGDVSLPTKPPRLQLRSPTQNPVIPILVMACNREDYLKSTLEYIFQYRPSARFPVVVSQGCDSEPVANLLYLEYDNKLVALKHHRTANVAPYFAIAQHYGWALGQIFSNMNYEAVIIVEDDLEISKDFFEYFSALYPVLQADPSLYCVSSWNDNGMAENVKDASTIHRTDVFPGLGWMMTKTLWDEIGPKWPDQYWDEFMRLPEIRLERQCLRPEISRNRNIGMRGTSEQQFWDKIARIKFNEEFVNFTSMDMSNLVKDKYDKYFFSEVRKTKIVPFTDLARYHDDTLRIIYNDFSEFVNLARHFGIMDDEKHGLPRTSYKGVVTFYHQSNKIFLTPSLPTL